LDKPYIKFKAVVFDLFDTIVTWDPKRLPAMEWKGRQIHSTMPWIFEAAESALGARYQQDAFIRAYITTLDEVHTERNSQLIEITCHERFVRTLTRLEVSDQVERRAIAERLTRIHMSGVRSVTAAPPARIEAVKRIARHYRLGLVSNFDDSQAGHEIMLDTGVRDLFDAIIISADVGMRKPNPLIFKRILELMRLDAHDILFVGDTPHDDVLGAKRAGMHAAWIRRPDKEIPEGVPAPDFIVDDLSELPDLIGC